MYFNYFHGYIYAWTKKRYFILSLPASKSHETLVISPATLVMDVKQRIDFIHPDGIQFHSYFSQVTGILLDLSKLAVLLGPIFSFLGLKYTVTYSSVG